MNVDTGEFQALSDRAGTLEGDQVILVRMLGWLVRDRVPVEVPARPELRLIRGGKP